MTAHPGWEQLVQEHEAFVRRVAYRLTGNAEDAADLTQEVFVRAFGAWDGFTPEHAGSVQGWLRRITTNLFLDQARRRQRLRIDLLADDVAARLVSRDGSADRPIVERTLDEDVAGALEALSAEYRATVVLCDIEQLSYEEAAAVLGVRVGTVRSRLHRGRGQLRNALAHRRTPTRRRWAGPAVRPALG